MGEGMKVRLTGGRHHDEVVLVPHGTREIVFPVPAPADDGGGFQREVYRTTGRYIAQSGGERLFALEGTWD